MRTSVEHKTDGAGAAARGAQQRLELLVAVGDLLISTVNDEPDWARLTRLLVPLLGDVSILLLGDGEHLDPAAASHAVHDQQHGLDAAVPACADILRKNLSEVVASGKSRSIQEIALIDHGCEGPPCACSRLPAIGAQTGLAAPLPGRARVHGVLLVARPTSKGAYTLEETRVVEDVAARIAAHLDVISALQRERRFTADVSHELRTPVAALVSAASLLGSRMDDVGPRARPPIKLLLDDVQRLRDLVEDLLAISKLDSAPHSAEVSSVEVRELVGWILTTRDWTSRFDVTDDDHTSLEVDPMRLELVLANLIGNVVQHGGGHGQVMIERVGRWTYISVVDQGPGIPPDKLPFIFDRFFKADAARGAHGTGLGLSIAAESARLLGGDITVDNSPGSGCRFTVKLPISPPPGRG
ncbi:MAG TPA: GAF domain-containing sensor histidine kinase [Actinomycetota bacterium]|nr:GAF domain-containing sensor histidine kinase [Actinomycetota bacterium]